MASQNEDLEMEGRESEDVTGQQQQRSRSRRRELLLDKQPLSI